jgi:hypothetical protein
MCSCLRAARSDCALLVRRSGIAKRWQVHRVSRRRFRCTGKLAQYDALLALGRHQGCPNAVLEALAAGVPVIANDSGGTREQVLHGKTGISKLVEVIERIG